MRKGRCVRFRRRVIAGVFGLSAIFLGVITFEVARGDPADAGSNNAQATVAASTPGRSPNDDDRIPPDKLTVQRQHEKVQQDALLSPIPTKKDPADVVYPYETPEPWPSGIFAHAYGPFPAIA